MFNETHKTSINGKDLVFIKSANIQAYPCGRRRSQQIDTVDRNKDGEVQEDEKYFIPFDPEARLNTEANNRKYSSLNGYTQTYLERWDENEKVLILSLGGYLFTINLSNSCTTANDFGNELLTTFDLSGYSSITKIYANILLEETPLFSGFKGYDTWVLRDQANNIIGETCLDLLNTSAANESTSARIQDFNNYYFSGLSFSVVPLSGKEETRSDKTVNESNKRSQQIISLCILNKIGSTWYINESARLPKIEHGDTADSVKIAHLEVDSLKQDGIAVPSLTLKEVQAGSTVQYQLQFSSVELPASLK